MKRLLLLTNIVTLSAAVYFGYMHFRSNPPRPQDISSCVPCKDFTGTKVEGIPAELAVLMVQQYKEGLGGKAMGDSMETRSVWFSVDSIKQFIWHMENELCKNTKVDKSKLGMRFYYGRYPQFETWLQYDDDPAHFDKMKLYQGAHTIFAVPTFYSNNQNIDFNPQDGYIKGDSSDNLGVPDLAATLKEAMQQRTGQKQMKAISGKKKIMVLTPNLGNATAALAPPFRPRKDSAAAALIIAADGPRFPPTNPN